MSKSLYVMELKPSQILKVLQENEAAYRDHARVLLKEVGIKRDQRLKKKFDTMVNDIKREILRTHVLTLDSTDKSGEIMKK